MARYVRSRLLWACVMVVGIVIVDFLITHILPGDPVDVLVGDFPAPPEYIVQVRHESDSISRSPHSSGSIWPTLPRATSASRFSIASRYSRSSCSVRARRCC